MTAPFPQDAYEIVTPRLIIRSATPDDAEALYRLLSTPENQPFDEVQPDLSPEVMLGRISRWGPQTASGLRAILMITLRETGELIGCGGFNCFETAAGETCDVALRRLLEEETKAEDGGVERGRRRITPYLTDFGVVLDHRHWGVGYGREVLCAQVEYAINELGCSIVRVETTVENEPWRAVMKSVGLSRLETKQPVSYGDKQIGFVYKIDPATWNGVKEDLKKSEKWLL
ncbi:hypothetical protein EsH8_I_000871 [Colletotrichum jinshuiense]